MKIGVVGATGAVGEAFMDILERRKFPIDELRAFASEKSEGLNVKSCGREWPVQSLREGCFDGLDLVFFSSGDNISHEWAPKAVESGAFAVDNSAAFRMNPDYALVVPEVNSNRLPSRKNPTIIANPNCSTIQLVVALSALRPFGLADVRVATYQAVSGAGKSGKEELLAQTHEHLHAQMRGGEFAQKLTNEPKVFPHEIAFNCIPQIGSFNENGFCTEEMKIANETRKILEMPKLKVSAFTVRVPALNSHSEAVWVTFERRVSKEEIMSAFEKGAGLRLFSQSTDTTHYPTARMASGEFPVFVGRVHQDLNDPHTWLFWVVADNVLKGAALNGLQIAEQIFKQ